MLTQMFAAKVLLLLVGITFVLPLIQCQSKFVTILLIYVECIGVGHSGILRINLDKTE